MKKYIAGALFGLIFAIVILSVGANTNGAPVLTYVYSNSMEPLIQVNDAFLVWPTKQLKAGDIIMFRPSVLKANFITHRIIAIGVKGYITKGDNSIYEDQESGEPEVLPDRIVGKVVSINGQPVVIPGLGNISAGITEKLGSYSKYLARIFLVLGFSSLFIGKRYTAHKRKPRRRLRLRHIYKSIVIIATILVMLNIYFGARVSKTEYLVSEYPGTLGDKVEVNQPGKLLMKVNNHGLVPVWTILIGIAPISIQNPPTYIWARSSKTMELDVLPHYHTGIYTGYVQIYNYPTVLPRSFVVYLHSKNRLIAIIAIGLVMGIIYTLLFKFLSYIHGFEEWIPLKAIKDKIFGRRLKRLMGRRRVR